MAFTSGLPRVGLRSIEKDDGPRNDDEVERGSGYNNASISETRRQRVRSARGGSCAGQLGRRWRQHEVIQVDGAMLRWVRGEVMMAIMEQRCRVWHQVH